METQLALFKTQNKPKQPSEPVITASDKVMQNFPEKLATHLHIFQGGPQCQSIALDYVNNLPISGEGLDEICKRSNKTKLHYYYHYVSHHFIKYDSWILKMILSSELKKDSKND